MSSRHCEGVCPCPRSRFCFNHTASTEIYTLSLHDALPISPSLKKPGILQLVVPHEKRRHKRETRRKRRPRVPEFQKGDRKSTRLNSSHSQISYAVFCLKKKIADLLQLTRNLCQRPPSALSH